MTWIVRLAKDAVRQLERLPKREQERIRSRIREMQDDPMRGDVLLLRGISRQNRSRFLQTINQRFEQLPHGPQGIIEEQRSHFFPQQAFAALFGPGRLE